MHFWFHFFYALISKIRTRKQKHHDSTEKNKGKSKKNQKKEKLYMVYRLEKDGEKIMVQKHYIKIVKDKGKE